MPEKHTTPKAPRRWPYIVLIILLLIAGTSYFYYHKYIASNRWKPILQAKLKELVTNSSDSLYHIEYSNFDLNLKSGDAVMTNFKLIPDTNVYNKLVALHKAPDNLFTLGVKQLTIKNVGARRAYQDKILTISQISIDQPDLTIVNKRLPFNDTVKVGKPKTPYDMIRKVFKQVKIDSIALKDISVNYINKSNPVVKKNAFKHLDINISDIYLDSLSAKDTSRFYYTKGVQLTLHDYRLATPDSLYYIKLKQIYFSTAQRKIILEKVGLHPRFSRKGFYEKLGHSQDRFTLDFKRIAINDIDLQQFLRNQKIYANTMDVSNANVEIYNDNVYKGRTKKSKIGKDPHQALQKVAVDLRLKRLNISNTDITYAEHDAKSNYTGMITFNNTNGYFSNVTNDADAKKTNPYMVAHLDTRFMNAGNMNINFKFNLTDKAGAFNYSGRLGQFNGQVLDKLVKPLAMIHVQSADIDQLKFNVDANNYGAKGMLQFYYKNLQVDFLKKDEDADTLKKKGMVSKLANSFVIEDSNPDKKGAFRPGPISFTRPATLSFFSLLYKALLTGLKPSVGFDAKTESKVSNILHIFHKFKGADKDKKKNDESPKKPDDPTQKPD
ncbi:hypothetical protein [Mucilaginibacter agri]|uniref:DUF748 domain-containing protein n=1 Tax=Mucilaginibacter agri TaxID=2695265 RepID=A0A965ZIV5_9SPHI|nr:hypothetical protein [Mucilaginibacter agri]NCD70461.1 hypothetical protein [Mucilaginibacter agri]